MHSATLALNWQTWGRHRWGLAGCAVIVAAICVVPHLYSQERLIGGVGESNVPFMMALLLPFCFVVLYLAYAFSHAELGVHRVSPFPNWMLTLPSSTLRLVMWPMISAALA